MSYWEDYYIIKYNTIFPNGYNKRFNCKEEIRKEIIKRIEEENKENEKENVKIPALIKGDEDFVKLTNKQLLVYYYFILKSYKNNNEVESEEINYTKMTKELKINSINTIKSSIKKLQEINYITFDKVKNVYKVSNKKNYVVLNVKIVKLLLSLELGAEILLYYSILKRFYELNKEREAEMKFGIRRMAKMLGHNVKDDSIYKNLKSYTKIFKELNLIKTKEEKKQIRGGEFLEYTLLDIKDSYDKEIGNYNKENNSKEGSNNEEEVAKNRKKIVNKIFEEEIRDEVLEQLANSIDFIVINK